MGKALLVVYKVEEVALDRMITFVGVGSIPSKSVLYSAIAFVLFMHKLHPGYQTCDACSAATNFDES